MGLDRRELIDQIGVFFLAGHETTASVLTWTFFILSQQPATVAQTTTGRTLHLLAPAVIGQTASYQVLSPASATGNLYSVVWCWPLFAGTTSITVPGFTFVGDGAENYVRTGNRRDLTTPPHADTVLDKLVAAGGDVISIGKIADIYAHKGITSKVKATGNAALFDATLDALGEAGDRSIVFTNFVDFDMLYGHRRDVDGYAEALEYFDARLPKLLEAMGEDDVVFICADHGCDPTWEGTDHTREHIPVIAYGSGIKPGALGKRETFADIGQTIAAFFNLPPTDYGTSFLSR